MLVEFESLNCFCSYKINIQNHRPEMSGSVKVEQFSLLKTYTLKVKSLHFFVF